MNGNVTNSRPTFVTIPTEIRLQVYHNLLVIPNTLLLDAGQCTYTELPSTSRARGIRSKASIVPDPHKKPFFAALLVCRQIYEEADSVMYRNNTFAANGVYCRRNLILAEQQLARIKHFKLYLLCYECYIDCPSRTLRYFAKVCQSLKTFEFHLEIPLGAGLR